ncbi:MAG: amidohydrolase [Candidatus Thermoplasmatota archaeon]|nr:amidohydrolase [Candidatus Thermoplasmatota archaeon]
MRLSADIVLIGARILTWSEEVPEAEAVALGQGRILAVGLKAEAIGFAGPETRIIDLEGRRVLPGFTDSHSHLASVGSRLSSLDLGDASSLEELQGKLLEVVRTREPGEWILGRNWDESGWPVRRYPLRTDLDRVAPHNPVALMRVDGHMAVANSQTLERLPLEGLVGVERDRDGNPTGILKEEAAQAVLDATRPDIDQIADGIRRMIRKAHSLGITAIHDIVDRREVAAYLRIHRRADLMLRVNLMISSEELPNLLGGGFSSGLGGQHLRLGPIKAFLDGSLGARTAALLQDFEDEPGNPGRLMSSEEEMFKLIREAAGAGFQLALHAIGDRGIEVALRGLSRVDCEGKRHRIEHLELPSDENLRVAKRLGIVASMQPNFIGKWGRPGGLYEERLGVERMRRNNPLRLVLDEGIQLAFGSDHMPFSPLFGVHWAVNAPFENQRLSAEEALRCYTQTPAYASFEEGLKGTIEPGKLADLVVLEKDPLQYTERIEEIPVYMTIFDGRIVYEGA